MSEQEPEKPVTESAIADRYNVSSGVRPFGQAPWDALGEGVKGEESADMPSEALEAFFMGIEALPALTNAGEPTKTSDLPPAPVDYSGITRDLCR